MPRLLPWLTKDDLRGNRDRNSSTTPTPGAQQPSSRRRPRTPSLGASSSHGGGGERSRKKRGTATDNTPTKGIDFLRSSRSPPTSPIASPPTEEYIIPGFENDDMYIMVEDEFYAVAQQFTRHLHHAEYIRRKKQAKKMNASVLRDMERSTGGSTEMSRETLKRKESDKLRERQRKGLEPAVRRPDDSDDAEEEEVEDEEEEREDDPWYGTSLHTFMTSPRKNRSLVGLERIRSKTRAAAGFGSEVAVAARPGSSSRPSSSSLRAGARLADEDLATSSGDDDDLEIMEVRSSRPNPLPQSEMRVRTSTVKRETPEVDVKPVVQKDTARRREVAFDDRRTIPRQQQQPVIKREYDRPRKPEPEPRKDASTTSTKPSASNVPRKRRFLDELDDIVVTPKIENDNISRKKDIIQDQPRKVLSTSTAKESRSTYRTTPEQKQQDKTAKGSRMSDIPTFLV